MPSSHLPNYLRANRKRLGLSQREVAYLLGVNGGAKVCRYERFTSIPSLETALACEILFQKPLFELFIGIYKEVEKDVLSRAKSLLRGLSKERLGRKTLRKLKALDLIIGSKRQIKTNNDD